MTTAPTKRWAKAPPGLSSAHPSPQAAAPTLSEPTGAADNERFIPLSLFFLPARSSQNPRWPPACCLCLSTMFCNFSTWARAIPPLDPRSQKPLGLAYLPAVSHGLQCLCWQQPQLCLCQAHPNAKAQQSPTA